MNATTQNDMSNDTVKQTRIYGIGYCRFKECRRAFRRNGNAQKYCSDECRALDHGKQIHDVPIARRGKAGKKLKTDVNKRIIIMKSDERMCKNPNCKEIFKSTRFNQELCDECESKGMKLYDVTSIQRGGYSQAERKRMERAMRDE